MKLTIIFMLVVTYFVGCSSGGGDTQEVEVSESSTTPQPRVLNENIRPPKLPNI